MIDLAHITKKDTEWMVAGLLTAFLLIAGEMWPAQRTLFQLAFAVLLLGYLVVRLILIFRAIRRSQARVTVSPVALQYLPHQQPPRIASWSDIVSIRFTRDDETLPGARGPFLDSDWWIQLRDRTVIFMPYQRRYRRLLLRAFQRHLPGFVLEQTEGALRSWQKGAWRCYERSLLE